MVLNAYGRIVEGVLFSLPNRYGRVKLDVSQLMPNHIHIIIVITKPVGTHHDASLRDDDASPRIRYIPRQKTKRGDKRELLSKCIGYFKMNTTKKINQMRNTPGHKIWQRNYYEHIIRSKNELNRTRKYIKDNPKNWKEDRNYE